MILPPILPLLRKGRNKTTESVTSNTGENELKQLALRSSNIPLSELAQKVKQLEMIVLLPVSVWNNQNERK